MICLLHTFYGLIPSNFLPYKLPRNPFGYADESFVGRGHGRKIRAYSPILQEAGSSEFDDDDDDDDYKE
jgi:hypothetical protein